MLQFKTNLSEISAYYYNLNFNFLQLEIARVSGSPLEHLEVILAVIISATTIKRVFGFAAVRFNFSKHTMTVLCEYIENAEKYQKKSLSLNRPRQPMFMIKQAGISIETSVQE